MQSQNFLILIVDDNAAFRERLKEFLQLADDTSEIILSADYQEALSALGSHHADTVLLDISLKGKSGIEILKRIRGEGQDCPVIMLTNHSDPFYREKCRMLGADFFLDKSKDLDLVPDIIHNLKYPGRVTINQLQ
jgi:DNA-binding NarL/FixJ family response regulator